ncbi:MAG TPA: flagellar biosynthetic protein FliO [Nitrospiraceae bacterium]|nr:flagellar biosynthetic protein FliO [Nitrospiraceae bacterium]
MELYDSVIRMIAALTVVLSLMAALAWSARRFLGKPLMPGAAPAIRVLATAHLGGRKSILLVSVADQTLIIGATATELIRLGTVSPRQAAARGRTTDKVETSSLAEVDAGVAG